MRNRTVAVIRIHTSLLQHLVLQHWSSAVDTPDVQYAWDRALTGSTHWGSRSDEDSVEICWHWAELREALVILDPHRIRTNLLLLGPTGLEEPRLRALIYIVDYLETLPWRAEVRRLLLQSRHPSRQ
jgi:hypothetical protein